MGQKNNVLTLRKYNNSINFLGTNSKSLMSSFYFLIFLKKVFEKKKIFLTNSILNFSGNQSILNLYLFFRAQKIKIYKRKRKRIQKNLKKKVFSLLWYKNLNFLKINFIVLVFTNLTKNFKKTKHYVQILCLLFKGFKNINKILFPRRFMFFIDFLQLTVLYIYTKINTNFYLYILSQIFKILLKKRHNRFVVFVNNLFKTIIFHSSVLKTKLKIKGVKFILSGRIGAKPRAKVKYFQVGSTPIQTIQKHITFSKIHIYTIYGIFGIKLWVYQE